MPSSDHVLLRSASDRANAIGVEGVVADKSVLDALCTKLNGTIPDWYVELVSTYPLCGLECQWQAYEPEDDWDGCSDILWSRPEDILSESNELYPGLGIIKLGFFNVACDENGSGDPYFINCNEGDNPPFYQVYHEKYAGGTETKAGDFDARIVA